MNLRLAVFTFIFGMGSLGSACPNLKGTYLCPMNQFHGDVFYRFDQQPARADWQFSIAASLPNGRAITSFEFLTGRVDQVVADGISGNKLLVTASCSAEALRVQGLANYDKPNPIRFSELITLTPEGDLSNLSHDLEGTPFLEICFRQ